MCKKYVNASARCYKSITLINNNIISHNIPFEGIRHDENINGISINNFFIMTNIDFLGTNNEEHKNENPLESKRTLDFIIRITTCDNKQNIGYDIDSFSVDLREMRKTNQINRACFDFLNYTRTTKIDNLDLPGGTGKYVIKVLVKDSEEKDYTIQTMSQLMIV